MVSWEKLHVFHCCRKKVRSFDAYAASLLEENIQQFRKILGTLSIDLDEMLTTDVKSFLVGGIRQLLYHPTCRSKYNYSRLERARSKKRKISSGEATGSIVDTRSHGQSSENSHTYKYSV